jgi:hypothetical protein
LVILSAAQLKPAGFLSKPIKCQFPSVLKISYVRFRCLLTFRDIKTPVPPSHSKICYDSRTWIHNESGVKIASLLICN